MARKTKKKNHELQPAKLAPPEAPTCADCNYAGEWEEFGVFNEGYRYRWLCKDRIACAARMKKEKKK